MPKLTIDHVYRLHTRPLQAMRLDRIYKALFHENRRVPREKNITNHQRFTIFDEYKRGIPGFADSGLKNSDEATFGKIHNFFSGRDRQET